MKAFNEDDDATARTFASEGLRTLFQVMSTNLSERQPHMQIHENNSNHFDDFIRLNEAWISEHFQLEEADLQLARDPGAIVRAGGYIFTGIIEGAVVGTAALFRHAPDEYELARMAVASAYRGQGLGRALALAALGKALALGAKRVIVLSNTRLLPALRLYQSLEFNTVREGPHPVYARCNIIMEKFMDSAQR